MSSVASAAQRMSTVSEASGEYVRVGSSPLQDSSDSDESSESDCDASSPPLPAVARQTTTSRASSSVQSSVQDEAKAAEPSSPVLSSSLKRPVGPDDGDDDDDDQDDEEAELEQCEVSLSVEFPVPRMAKAAGHAVTVQVNWGDRTVFDDSTWRMFIMEVYNLLEGEAIQKRVLGPPVVSGTFKLDITSSEALTAISDAYGIRSDLDVSKLDNSSRYVYSIRLPSISRGSPADLLHVVVDNTGRGMGVAVVYRKEAFYVQGPDSMKMHDIHAQEPNDLYAATTVGEVRNFSPVAGLFLSAFCDLICRVTLNRTKKDVVMTPRVSMNCHSSETVEACLSSAASAFSKAVLARVPRVTRARSQVGFDKDRAAKLSSSPKSAIKKRKTTTVYAALKVRVKNPVAVASEQVLVFLCNRIRVKDVPTTLIRSHVSMWMQMLRGSDMPRSPPPAPGNVSENPWLEAALAELVFCIRNRALSEDCVRSVGALFDLCCQ